MTPELESNAPASRPLDVSDGAPVGLPAADAGCCPAGGPEEAPGYRLQPFVTGWVDTAIGRVPRVATSLSWEDRAGALRVRLGVRRYEYRVVAGLYAVGSPGEGSPALVTANYKLTFDALRSRLAGVDAWVIVLDTRGINVWCAAGKGTFGTDELVRRVKATALASVVSHRVLVLPQLAAPGVAAHRVRQRCGFAVAYGPVRSGDLRAFLEAGMVATPAMRQVTFDLGERLILTPVELANLLRPSRWVLPILLAAGAVGPGFAFGTALRRGAGAIAAYAAAALAGSVLTPALLPWLPGRAFAFKGAAVGAGTALAGLLLFRSSLGWADRLALLAALSVGASWCAMLFTGSTPYTSPSGVEREMRRALPFQLGGLGLAALIWIGSRF